MLRRPRKAIRETFTDRMHTAAYRASFRSLGTVPSIRATPVETPWMASIQYDAPTHQRFGWHNACGVLIAPRMLLTCAHPFSQATQPPGTIPITERTYYARIGGAGLNEGLAYAIIETHLHPEFDPGTAAHDLAIAVLAAQAKATPIHRDLLAAQTGDQVVALGWPGGRDGHGHLTRAHTTLIDPRIGGGKPATLCAANLPRPDDLCAGYSGGPVVRLTPDREARLRGIISHGVTSVDLDEIGPPAVIVDTLAEAEFIRRTVHDHRAPETPVALPHATASGLPFVAPSEPRVQCEGHPIGLDPLEHRGAGESTCHLQRQQ
jgi:hypothetical protein